jgi:putative oxidoreductase
MPPTISVAVPRSGHSPHVPPNGRGEAPLFGGVGQQIDFVRCDMRALNSTFPNSWAGAGLLLLRLVAGFSTLSTAALQLCSGVTLVSAIGVLAQTMSAILLISGLWTPVVAILLVAAEVYRAGAAARFDTAGVLRAAIAVSLAMTGPGAWSIDARAFGRRRIDVARLGE